MLYGTGLSEGCDYVSDGHFYLESGCSSACVAAVPFSVSIFLNLSGFKKDFHSNRV